MIPTRNTSFLLSAVLLAGLAAGLPASAATTIVNINGAGSSGAGVAQAYAYPLAPGSLIGMIDPVVVDPAAGSYTVSDGYGQPGALYDAWNYQLTAPGSWDSHFYVAVEQGTTSIYELLIDGLSNRDPGCANHNCSWSSEAEASAAFLATPAFTLDLATDTAVSFSSTDFYLLDNTGGISLAITPVETVAAVPEPSDVLLLLMSSPLLVFALRRSRPRVDGVVVGARV